MKDFKETRVRGPDLVASHLLECILRGEWRQGSRIPSIDRLETMLPFSRVTIHLGIRKLVVNGFLSARRGCGTYVRNDQLRQRIALLNIASVDHPTRTLFSSLVTHKAEKYLMEHGCEVDIYSESRTPLDAGRFAHDIGDRRFDGLLSIQSAAPVLLPQLAFWQGNEIPHVHVGVHRQCHSVDVDFGSYVEAALTEILARGHRTLACLVSLTSPIGKSVVEQAAKREVVIPSGWQGYPEKGDELPEEAGFRGFLHLWQQGEKKPTAIICFDDVIAKGATQAVLALRLKKQPLIVAPVNKDSGIYYPIPIVSFETNTDELVSKAVELLFRILKDPNMLKTSWLVKPVLRNTPHPLVVLTKPPTWETLAASR